jgi:DNA polymerase I-like protein with 3'-5' exonuclease and polymerase domains
MPCQPRGTGENPALARPSQRSSWESCVKSWKPLINVVHDELLAECPTAEADATAAWLKTHMEGAMQEVVQGQVPTPVEVKISQSWAG